MQPRAPIVQSKWPLVVLAFVVWSSSGSSAIDLLVYNNNDRGAGSLRQAISDNNAAGGGNTILISNVVTGTITLTSGELVISKDLTLLGPGPNVLAVSGNNAGRIFNVTNSAIVSISGLTVSNGKGGGVYPFSGGGIFNAHATLTISNCIFSGNSDGHGGGGIYNFAGPGNAVLTLIACTFNANYADGALGGAIFNDAATSSNSATLTIIASTLSGNSAYGGGAIFNYTGPGNGVLTISNCTFSGNASIGGGGGVILNENTTFISSATLTVIASTFSGNSGSPGGAIYNEFSGSTLEIGNTVFKAGSSDANIYNSGGTVTSDGFNLSSDGGGGFLTNLGDQINTDPKLGPLQDNGGPTPTIAPLPGSPAINQGKSFGLTTDQRGRPRPYVYPGIPSNPFGDGSDIGAVELYPPVTLVVSNTNDKAAGSLRQALLDGAPGDSITFASGVSGTITLTSGELLIRKSVNITGPTAAGVTVSGNNASRGFHIGSNTTVTISGLTITNGAAIFGGGIYNDHSTLTVSNCTLSGNSAFNGGGNGGGIFNDGISGSATLTIANSTLSGNSAGAGGGIFNDGVSGSAALKIIASTLSGNSASTGGGIYNQGASGSATLELANSILNTGTSGENILNNSGTVTSDGYNLSSDNGGGFLGALGDQTNTDPMLGPLQNNGGPTMTMALRVGSPAIDQGKSFGLTTDQRGAPRPYDFSSIPNAPGGDGSDIGAFELGCPTLSIQRFNSNAVLFWQSFYGDFTLQSVTNIISSNSWATVGGTPLVVTNQYVLTNGPISGNQFFRLKGN